MVIKTYAIHGLSEWHGDIKAGAISVRVSFTGGTASPSGALPAYFMTKDPVTQFVIENSKEYKNGFIRLEMQQTIAGEHPRMATPKPSTSEVAGSGMPEPDSGEGVTGPADSEDSKSEGGFVLNSFSPIKVATKSDAIEWLKEHYPEKEYTAVKLRSKAAFDAACEECGVVFEIAE